MQGESVKLVFLNTKSDKKLSSVGAPCTYDGFLTHIYANREKLLLNSELPSTEVLAKIKIHQDNCQQCLSYETMFSDLQRYTEWSSANIYLWLLFQLVKRMRSS